MAKGGCPERSSFQQSDHNTFSERRNGDKALFCFGRCCYDQVYTIDSHYSVPHFVMFVFAMAWQKLFMMLFLEERIIIHRAATHRRTGEGEEVSQYEVDPKSLGAIMLWDCGVASRSRLEDGSTQEYRWVGQATPRPTVASISILPIIIPK